MSKCLFVDDMSLYVKNPKASTQETTRTNKEFGKVSGYKINKQTALL